MVWWNDVLTMLSAHRSIRRARDAEGAARGCRSLLQRLQRGERARGTTAPVLLSAMRRWGRDDLVVYSAGLGLIVLYMRGMSHRDVVREVLGRFATVAKHNGDLAMPCVMAMHRVVMKRDRTLSPSVFALKELLGVYRDADALEDLVREMMYESTRDENFPEFFLEEDFN
jgi:hypothetical protein